MAHVSTKTYKKVKKEFDEITFIQKKYKNKNVHD